MSMVQAKAMRPLPGCGEGRSLTRVRDAPRCAHAKWPVTAGRIAGRCSWPGGAERAATALMLVLRAGAALVNCRNPTCSSNLFGFLDRQHAMLIPVAPVTYAHTGVHMRALGDSNGGVSEASATATDLSGLLTQNTHGSTHGSCFLWTRSFTRATHARTSTRPDPDPTRPRPDPDPTRPDPNPTRRRTSDQRP